MSAGRFHPNRIKSQLKLFQFLESEAPNEREATKLQTPFGFRELGVKGLIIFGATDKVSDQCCRIFILWALKRGKRLGGASQNFRAPSVLLWGLLR